MSICKVIDYFETQIGSIYILQFFPNDFRPRLGLKLKYSEVIVQISSMSLRSKEDYCLGGSSIKKVWSCGLQTFDKKEIKIPIGTVMSLLRILIVILQSQFLYL